MLITLSHCVVVRTLADGGSAGGAGGSAGGAGGSATGSAFFACAMRLCASIRAFFCASRAILVLSAIAFPAATRFGFFVSWRAFLKSLVDLVALPYILLKKLYLIEQLPSNVH